jgi:hypothetical protein
MTRDEAINAIIQEFLKQGVTMPEQIAYGLGTVKREAGNAMLPVREGNYLKHPMGYLRRLRYYPYYGRGLVQLTWKANYLKYQKILGIPLVANPDLALRFDVAAFILVHGMKHGVFTGKALSDYIRPGHVDFIGARRIINGTNKASLVASYGKEFLPLVRERVVV